MTSHNFTAKWLRNESKTRCFPSHSRTDPEAYPAFAGLPVPVSGCDCGKFRYGTPECKVHRWQHELDALRRIVLESGLTEECKWGVPCYTYQGKNMVLVFAFKDNCFISFFKGALLQDEHGILTFAGKNSLVDKMIRSTIRMIS